MDYNIEVLRLIFRDMNLTVVDKIKIKAFGGTNFFITP